MLRSIFCTGDCPRFLPITVDCFIFPWIVLTTSSFPGICQCFDMFWRPLLGTWTCNLEGMLLEIPHPTCSGWNDTQLDGLLDSILYSAGACPIKYRSRVCVRKKQLQSCWLIAGSRWWVRYTYEQKWCSRSLHIQGISYHRGYSPGVQMF